VCGDECLSLFDEALQLAGRGTLARVEKRVEPDG
jgi:hypothetical protein